MSAREAVLYACINFVFLLHLKVNHPGLKAQDGLGSLLVRKELRICKTHYYKQAPVSRCDRPEMDQAIMMVLANETST